MIVPIKIQGTFNRYSGYYCGIQSSTNTGDANAKCVRGGAVFIFVVVSYSEIIFIFRIVLIFSLTRLITMRSKPDNVEDVLL